MDKELKYLFELDYVLHFLATSPYAKGLITEKDLTKHISTEIIQNERLLKILNKLIKDNFLKTEIRELNTGIESVYIITFDGLVYDELGGYNATYLENNKLKNILEQQNKNQEQIKYLTIIIAIGTGMAAIYYFLEIVKYFSKCCCWF